jgi:DNA-binding response OmpR family regulator
MRILLVEDDPRLGSTLAEALRSLRYHVDWAEDGLLGWGYLESVAYDVIVLDIMVPHISGIELCRKVRLRGTQTPILMLTAKDASQDKVLALDSGADDYVVKPFDLDELTARIRALLRRGANPLSKTLCWGELELNPNTYEVFYQQQLINLTPKEYQLLELFVKKPQQVLTRSQILDQLWSFDDPPGEEVVKVHVKDIRKKLRNAGASPDFIETVYGLGYRLKSI